MNDDRSRQNNPNSNNEQHTKKFEAIITPNPSRKNILRPEKDYVQDPRQRQQQAQGRPSGQGPNILRPNPPQPGQGAGNSIPISKRPAGGQGGQAGQSRQVRPGGQMPRQDQRQRSASPGRPVAKGTPAGRPRPTTRQTKPAKKTKALNKSTLIFYSILLTCLLLATTLISAFALSAINDILAISRSSEKITVLIDEEMDTRQVISKLKEKDLIKNKRFCILFAKLQKYDKIKYQSGIHELRPNMGLEGMLQTIRSARTSNQTVTLVFPEGYTVDQIFEKLEKFDVCSASSLYSTLNEIDFSRDYPFIKQIDNKDDRYRYLEGYLYPDTYNFFIGENATSVIKKFLNNFKARFEDEYKEQAEKLNMSIDDIIILASVIEKEGKNFDQMVMISGILHNRLNDRTGSLSKLDCDSTYGYIMNIDKKHISTTQYDKLMTLYNTYQLDGLPAGAICNPGDNAIYAALFPQNTDYKFFRHDKAGKIYLAYTLNEHNANERKVTAANNALAN